MNKPFYLSCLDMSQKPFENRYLSILDKVITNAQNSHSRTFAIRLDLRYSREWFINDDSISCYPDLSSDVMKHFLGSLNAQIEHYRYQRRQEGLRDIPCELRYLWVREQDEAPYPHYHVVLFLNRDLFWQLGSYDPEARNLRNMIISAWLRALKVDQNDYRYLVHFPENNTYTLNTNSPDYPDQYRRFIFRTSYLCKKRTKHINRDYRSIGYSLR